MNKDDSKIIGRHRAGAIENSNEQMTPPDHKTSLHFKEPAAKLLYRKTFTMSCYLNPVEDDQCVFIAYEGEMMTAEAGSMQQETGVLLGIKQWNRVVIDLTQLESVPPALDLFEFSEYLFLDLPRGTWIALVLRPEQMGHARYFENIARNRGVLLICFDDMENAGAWIKISPVLKTANECNPN